MVSLWLEEKIALIKQGVDEETASITAHAYDSIKQFQRLNEVGMYEDAFRDLFIQKMVKPHFSFYREEANLFDLVAYRTDKDAENDTPPYIWQYRLDQEHPKIVENYLKRYNLEELPPPPPFLGYDQLIGFEFKTNADNPYRFLTQLPRYCWFFDSVYLVLGDKVKKPRNLPEWIGVIKYNGESFIFEKQIGKAHSFLGDKGINFAKWYQPHKSETFDYTNASGWDDYIGFMRRLAINSVFHREIVPYTAFDYGLIKYLRKVNARIRFESKLTEEKKISIDKILDEPAEDPVVEVPKFEAPKPLDLTSFFNTQKGESNG